MSGSAYNCFVMIMKSNDYGNAAIKNYTRTSNNSITTTQQFQFLSLKTMESRLDDRVIMVSIQKRKKKLYEVL